MNDANNHFTETELEKLRQEVLEWIEKNELLKNPKSSKKLKAPTQARAASKKPIAKKIQPKKIQTFSNKRREIFVFPKIFEIKKESQIPQKMVKFFETFFSRISFLPKNEMSFQKRAGAFLLIIFLALQAYTFASIYFFGWNNFFVRMNGSLLRYPAARVKNSFISYKEFAISEKMEKYLPFAWWAVSEDTLHKNILRYLWIELEFKKNNFTISKDEIDFRYTLAENYFGGREAFLNLLNEMKLTPADFKRFAIVPDIIADKIYEKIKTNDPQFQRVKKRTEAIIKKINKEPVNSDEAAMDSESIVSFYRSEDLSREFEIALSQINFGQESIVVETDKGMYVVQYLDSLPELNLRKLLIISVDENYSKKRVLENYFSQQKPRLFISEFH